MGKKTDGQSLGSTERVYRFLVGYIRKNLYPPCVREIAEGVGLKSTSSVYVHLRKLEKQGRIEVKDWMPRAIRLKGYKIVKDGGQDG